MNIIVCVKRVPDLAEADVELKPGGEGIVEDDLAYGINEWDNFAVEAAVRLKEEHGGKVTAVTVGDEDAEEILRRALAMGADEALHLQDPGFEGSDAQGIATILFRAIEPLAPDLVLTGAISSDQARGHVGGLLAARLGVPMVALATDLSVTDRVATVRHEVEGGLERIVSVDLPALVTVQTGINEPRYVSIRGIRKVAGLDIPVRDAAALDLNQDDVGSSAARITIEALFLPERGEGAEILEGDDASVIEQLVDRLHQQGGL